MYGLLSHGISKGHGNAYYEETVLVSNFLIEFLKFSDFHDIMKYSYTESM